MENNTTDQSGNGSVDSGEMGDENMYYFSLSEHLPYVIICILMVALNSFVILLFAFRKNLRKAPNFLFISLSTSDLLTGLVGLPLILVCSTTPNCITCLLAPPFILFTSTSTILHIVVITYERYVKIAYPFRMKKVGTPSFEFKVIAAVWITSFVVSFIKFTWSPLSTKACYELEEESIRKKNRILTTILLTMFVALPILLTIFADVRVFVIVREQLGKIEVTSLANERISCERAKKESKVIAIMSAMLVYFVICWIFYYVAIVYHTFVEEAPAIPEWLYQPAEILRCTTSCVNPILYALLKRDFRQTIVSGVRYLIGNHFRHSRKEMSVRYSNDAATICKRTSQTEATHLSKSRLSQSSLK